MEYNASRMGNESQPNILTYLPFISGRSAMDVETWTLYTINIHLPFMSAQVYVPL